MVPWVQDGEPNRAAGQYLFMSTLCPRVCSLLAACQSSVLIAGVPQRGRGRSKALLITKLNVSVYFMGYSVVTVDLHRY